MRPALFSDDEPVIVTPTKPDQVWIITQVGKPGTSDDGGRYIMFADDTSGTCVPAESKLRAFHDRARAEATVEAVREYCRNTPGHGFIDNYDIIVEPVEAWGDEIIDSRLVFEDEHRNPKCPPAERWVVISHHPAVGDCYVTEHHPGDAYEWLVGRSTGALTFGEAMAHHVVEMATSQYAEGGYEALPLSAIPEADRKRAVEWKP